MSSSHLDSCKALKPLAGPKSANPQDGDIKMKKSTEKRNRRSDGNKKTTVKASRKANSDGRNSAEGRLDTCVDRKLKLSWEEKEADMLIQKSPRKRRAPNFLTYHSFHKRLDFLLDCQLQNQTVVEEKSHSTKPLSSSEESAEISKDVVECSKPEGTKDIQPNESEVIRELQCTTSEESKDIQHTAYDQVSDESEASNSPWIPFSRPLSSKKPGNHGGASLALLRQRRTDWERPLPVVLLAKGEELTAARAAQVLGEEVPPKDIPFLPVPERCAWPCESLDVEVKDPEGTRVPMFWVIPQQNAFKKFKRPREFIKFKGSSDSEYGYDADEEDLAFLSELTSSYCGCEKIKATVISNLQTEEDLSAQHASVISPDTWEEIVEVLEKEAAFAKRAWNDQHGCLSSDFELQMRIQGKNFTQKYDKNILDAERRLIQPSPPYLSCARMVSIISSIIEKSLPQHKFQTEIKPGLQSLSADLYFYWLGRWHSGNGSNLTPLRQQQHFPLLAWEPPAQNTDHLSSISTQELEKTYEWLRNIRLELDWARMLIDLASRREKRKKKYALLVKDQVQLLIGEAVSSI